MKVWKSLLFLFCLLALISCGSAPPAENNDGKVQATEATTATPQDEAGNEVDTGDDSKTNTTSANPVNNNSTDSLFQKFVEARKHHDSEAVNRLAGQILSRNPNDTRVLNVLGVMAIEQEKYDLARLFIDKILAKDPNNATAINNLGVVELKSDNLRLALIQFKKASAFDSKNSAAHANLGAIYLKYRNYQNAAQELNDAVDNGDHGPDTLSNLAFAQTGTGDYNGAKKNYELALSKEPNNPTILLNYSALLVEKMHRYKDGIKVLNKIRFIAHEPAILDKVEILLKKAENPVAKTTAKPDPEKGVSE